MPRALRPVAAAALVAGGWAGMSVVGGAGPAGAAATISISSPRGGQAYQSPPAIRGTVTPDSTEHLSRDVQLEVKETDQPGLVDQTTTVSGTSGATSAASFAWQPAPAYNGNYQVVVAAWQTNPVGMEDGPYNATQAFVLQVPPAKPAAPAVVVGADGGSTSVSWRPNTEPDLLGYQVMRSPAFTGGKVPTIPKTDPHCSPGGCSYNDSDVTGGTGYQYQIAAVRSAGPGTTTGVTSTSDSSAKVIVPAPSTSSNGAASAGGATPATAAAQPGPSVAASAPLAPALAKTGRVDLSGFASLLDRSRAASGRSLPEPDPGFQNSLPYSPAQPEVGQGGGIPVRRDQVLGAADRPAPVRPWAFFALGLLITAVAVHLLWLRGEVGRGPGLEALPAPGTQDAAPPIVAATLVLVGGWGATPSAPGAGTAVARPVRLRRRAG